MQTKAPAQRSDADVALAKQVLGEAGVVTGAKGTPLYQRMERDVRDLAFEHQAKGDVSRPYILRVGPGQGGSKTVVVPQWADVPSDWGLVCPTHVPPRAREPGTAWPDYDSFSVFVDPDTWARERKVTVVRTDAPGQGWANDVQIPCRIGPYRPVWVDVGQQEPGRGGVKTVPLPPPTGGGGVVCPAYVDSVSRLPHQFPDTSALSVDAARRELTVRRLDAPGNGWGLQMRVPCHVGPYEPFIMDVGPSAGAAREKEWRFPEDVPTQALSYPRRVARTDRVVDDQAPFSNADIFELNPRPGRGVCMREGDPSLYTHTHPFRSTVRRSPGDRGQTDPGRSRVDHQPAHPVPPPSLVTGQHHKKKKTRIRRIFFVSFCGPISSKKNKGPLYPNTLRRHGGCGPFVPASSIFTGLLPLTTQKSPFPPSVYHTSR